VKSFLLHHHHEPSECRAAFAAWHGFTSPLRHQTARCSCTNGAHELWWEVQAQDAAHALTLLPAFVARRTTAVEIREVPIP
jgi:hypothetical protein